MEIASAADEVIFPLKTMLSLSPALILGSGGSNPRLISRIHIRP